MGTQVEQTGPGTVLVVGAVLAVLAGVAGYFAVELETGLWWVAAGAVGMVAMLTLLTAVVAYGVRLAGR